MRFTLINILVTLSLYIGAVVAVLREPAFTKVFDGTLTSTGSLGTISGPFGQRAVAGFGVYVDFYIHCQPASDLCFP